MNLDALSIDCRQKIKEGRGSGRFNNYISWRSLGDLSQRNKGMSYFIPDDKYGRAVTIFGPHEKFIYYWLWWQSDIIEIREHMPILDIEEAHQIAKDIGAKYPYYKGKLDVIDTDFVITKNDGSIHAISAQISKDHTTRSSDEDNKNLIEKEYWSRHGATWEVMYADEINSGFVNNISFIHRYYGRDSVYNDISAFLYLVARKYIDIDLNIEFDNLKNITDEYFSKETFKELRRYVFSGKHTLNPSEKGWIYDTHNNHYYFVG